jgi:hypothetical protein
VIRFGRVLVLAGALVGLCVAPSLARADAASNYRAAVLADHPVSYWRLDDTTGTVAHDQQGVNDAMITGSVTLGQPGPMAGDSSMEISDAYITPGTPESLNPTGEFTIELWARYSDTDANTCKAYPFGELCGLYGRGGYGPSVYVEGTTGGVGSFVYTSTGSVSVSTPSSLADGTWHYIVITRSPTTLSEYIDGTLIDSASAPSPNNTADPGRHTTIANGECGCQPFAGNESEVAFYDYALSAAQVAAHYAAAGMGVITLVSGNGQIGSLDPNVTVTDSCSGTAQQATIVSPYSGYWGAPISGSQWDGPNTTHIGCNGTYQTTFTLPAGATSPSISMNELADNSTDVSLNNNQPFISRNVPGQCETDYGGPPISGSTSSGFVTGVNTLTFNVDNCYPSHGENNTGLDFVATVTYTPANGNSPPPPPSSPPPPPSGPTGCIGIWCGTVSFVGGSQDSSCPDVVIYGARGSGEDNTAANVGMGPVPYEVGQEIINRLPVGHRVEMIGVNYPAVPPTALVNYEWSVVTGTEVLVEGYNGQGGLVSLVLKCPKVAVVLVGLSQGAHVIHYTLSLAPQRPSAVTRRIAASLLFGDPVHQPNQSYNVSNQAAKGVLLGFTPLPGNNGPPDIVSSLQPATQSYCLPYDPICDSAGALEPGAFVAYRTIHDGYGSSPYIADAASFAVNRIKGMLGRTATAAARTRVPSLVARASRAHRKHVARRCIRRQGGPFDATSVCPQVAHGVRPQRQSTYKGSSRDRDRISMTASNNAASVSVKVVDGCGTVFTGSIIVTRSGIFDGTTPGGFEITGLVTSKRVIKGTVTDPSCKNLPIRSFTLRRRRH